MLMRFTYFSGSKEQSIQGSYCVFFHISLADPNACNPVNPTTPKPFIGHYETCVDKVQNGGTCFSFGPNGSDSLKKGGYCQFPSFMVDMCYNTCGT